MLITRSTAHIKVIPEFHDSMNWKNCRSFRNLQILSGNSDFGRENLTLQYCPQFCPALGSFWTYGSGIRDTCSFFCQYHTSCTPHLSIWHRIIRCTTMECMFLVTTDFAAESNSDSLSSGGTVESYSKAVAKLIYLFWRRVYFSWENGWPWISKYFAIWGSQWQQVWSSIRQQLWPTAAAWATAAPTWSI